MRRYLSPGWKKGFVYEKKYWRHLHRFRCLQFFIDEKSLSLQTGSAVCRWGECITNCIIHRILINENLSVRYIGLSSAGSAAWFQSFRSQVANPRCSGPSAMVMKGLLKFLGQVILLTKISLQGFTRASRGVCWQQKEFSSINKPARCGGA